MDKGLHKEILAKAFFVAGSDSRFRDEKDPVAISAVKDAEAFLTTLPQNIEKPYISAGTTAAPDKIVSFTWLEAGRDGLKSVYISCKGNGLYDASWEDQDENGQSLKSISLKELIDLNIAQKINFLKGHGMIPKPSMH